MSNISTWSTTAASNNSAAPNGFPENMAPSGVNDAARETMAAVRRWTDDGGWHPYGHTATYASATSFTVATDVTAIYHANRRLRAVGVATGTIYGTISSSSYAAPNTTVNVTWDSGSLSNEALTISVAYLAGNNKAYLYSDTSTLPTKAGIQIQSYTVAAAGGGVDAITATFTPTIAALADQMRLCVIAAGANVTTTPTFAPDGLAAKTIVKGSNQALVAGDIPGANFPMDLEYNAALAKWVLLNPAYAVSVAATAPVLTYSSNYLAANVTMTLANTYYDGPSLALGAGTYLLVGQITGYQTGEWTIKLWDGTTVISSMSQTAGAGYRSNLSISGIVVLAGAATWKISAACNAASCVMEATPAYNGAGCTNTASYLLAIKIV